MDFDRTDRTGVSQSINEEPEMMQVVKQVFILRAGPNMHLTILDRGRWWCSCKLFRIQRSCIHTTFLECDRWDAPSPDFDIEDILLFYPREMDLVLDTYLRRVDWGTPNLHK